MSQPLHLRTTYVHNTGPASWAKWLSDGDNENTDSDIHGDMDGIKDISFMVDLSKMCSEMFGKQCPQMATYRLEYLTLQLQNVDDIFDNDMAQEFGGYTEYLEPTGRRVKALQLARQVERETERADIDEDSFLLATDNNYRGFRFNLTADNQVYHATTEPFTTLSGTQWDAQEIFQCYEDMRGTDATFDDEPENALWTEADWDRCGSYSSFGFSVGYTNHVASSSVPGTTGGGVVYDNSDFAPEDRMFQLQLPSGMHIPVLGGLMRFNINRSATGEPGITADDWQIRITAGVSGWSGF